MEKINIPIYRAKINIEILARGNNIEDYLHKVIRHYVNRGTIIKNEDDYYAIGRLNSYDEIEVFDSEDKQILKYPYFETTLAIHFPDMLDSQKNIRQSFFHVYTKDSLAHEGTTRGRSILFHGIALFHAINLGINEIITPENGVISINLPLTPSRTCSNSTKTMHPYFIKKFEEALMLLGLQIQINNPYLLKTKGEMLVENRNPDLIQQLATKTLSCSHGGGHTPGWHRHSLNCGYCIPCTIRRASIHKFNASLDKCTDYGHKLNSKEINLSIHEKRLDLLALAYFLNKELTKDELKREIKLMANIDNIDNVADMLLRSYTEIKQYVYDKADDNIKGLFTCQLV